MNQLIIAFGCGLVIGIVATAFIFCFNMCRQMERWKDGDKNC